MNKQFAIVAALMSASVASSLAWADPDMPGFTVDFSQCTEFAGVGPIDFARASALVPAAFSTLPVGATAGLVVRATGCAGVSVNGGHAVPTNISQIGVEIVPPDGTGDINNYTLVYLSNNSELVEQFNKAGVPALFDPDLTYQFTYDSTGKAGYLYVEADGPGLPGYFIAGNETDPTAPYPGGFRANWWYAGKEGKVKQASVFPDIAFGTSSVTFFTSKTSVLGKLIGGNSYSAFTFLPLRGVYSSAHMVVSTSHK